MKNKKKNSSRNGMMISKFPNARKVQESDFEDVELRITSAEFKKIIPDLNLADMLLIDIARNKLKRNKVVKYLKIEKKFRCHICDIHTLDFVQAYNHLNSESHLSAMQNTKLELCHPVFTIPNTGNYEESLDKANKLLFKLPRFIFLFAHQRAKEIELHVAEDGLPVTESKIEFSGKKIVQSASKKELEQIVANCNELSAREKKSFSIRNQNIKYSNKFQEEVDSGNPSDVKPLSDKRKRKLGKLFHYYWQFMKEKKQGQSGMGVTKNPAPDIVVDGNVLDFPGLSDGRKKELFNLKINRDDLLFISSLIGPIKEKKSTKNHEIGNRNSVTNKPKKSFNLQSETISNPSLNQKQSLFLEFYNGSVQNRTEPSHSKYSGNRQLQSGFDRPIDIPRFNMLETNSSFFPNVSSDKSVFNVRANEYNFHGNLPNSHSNGYNSRDIEQKLFRFEDSDRMQPDVGKQFSQFGRQNDFQSSDNSSNWRIQKTNNRPSPYSINDRYTEEHFNKNDDNYYQQSQQSYKPPSFDSFRNFDNREDNFSPGRNTYMSGSFSQQRNQGDFDRYTNSSRGSGRW